MPATQTLLQNDDPHELWETREAEMPVSEAGRKVSEAEYWKKYYENSDFNYEWKNGYLEVSPVSDYESFMMFDWFQSLLRHFLTANPIAKAVGLEFGFRMELPHDTVIRKPDLAVVCNENPIALGLKDLSYGGIYDLCIEVISYSSKQEEERDTKEKRDEYCAGGVREYYILDGRGKETAFYRRDSQGRYARIRPDKDGILRSHVLDGFAFKESDLYRQPSAEEMAEDALYQTFVMPAYQREKQRGEKLLKELDSEKKRVEQERKRAETERKRAETEHKRAETEHKRAERLAAKLRELGVLDE
jgi:Uma2 family endonuclease